MTSRSLGDDGDSGLSPNAEVAQQDPEPERVGSDRFVDAILSMAEHRAEAGDVVSALSEDEPQTKTVAEPPVAARVVSDDFIDAVLEVAEARVASAVAAEDLRRARIDTAPDAGGAREALERSIPTTRKSAGARVPTGTGSRLRAVGLKEPSAEVVRRRTAFLDGAALAFASDTDTDDDLAHVHPRRPTPWWRKRPSLEVIFAIIATVLMVVGLTLVVAELF